MATVVFTGCSSLYQDHGNITQTSLNDTQQRTVASEMASTLFSHYGSRTIFDFPHSSSNHFASILASAIRARGIGVNEQDDNIGYYPVLHYQLINLNPEQFYSEMDVNGFRMNRLWSVQNNILAPFSVKTQGVK